MNQLHGYFGIGVYRPKCGENVGTLWRSAWQLGASFIFTIGRRYKKQASDTVNAWQKIPCYEYPTLDDFYLHVPMESRVVAVEMGGKPLTAYRHPQRAIYLLGAEDNGLPLEKMPWAEQVVSIESVRTQSFNVAVAGSIVLYDRMAKLAEVRV